MLNIICALKHEARPIIDYFRLNHDGSAHEYTAYSNDRISITITGTGKQAASEGTRFAVKHFGANERNMFLNIGIAGHKDLPIGTPLLADSITDFASGRVWHLRKQLPAGIHILPLVTVDRPRNEYPEHVMVDMEASGFISSIPPERAQCLKIISDNSLSPPQNINHKMVIDLVSDNITVIDKLLSHLHRCDTQPATACS